MRDGVHTRQVASPSLGNTKTISVKPNPHTNKLIPEGKLERPNNPSAMFLDCGKKPEVLIGYIT